MYISIIVLYVADRDRAIAFYTDTLGWNKTMDVPMGEDGGRWVTLAPPEGKAQFTLYLDAEEAGGDTNVILEVDDVEKTAAQLAQRGVNFIEAARREPWGGWARFEDSEGNVLALHSPPSG
ncbi:MAG: VOC family protein [Vulcanimicrobiaceae bacterium]